MMGCDQGALVMPKLNPPPSYCLCMEILESVGFTYDGSIIVTTRYSSRQTYDSPSLFRRNSMDLMFHTVISQAVKQVLLTIKDNMERFLIQSGNVERLDVCEKRPGPIKTFVCTRKSSRPSRVT